MQGTLRIAWSSCRLSVSLLSIVQCLSSCKQSWASWQSRLRKSIADCFAVPIPVLTNICLKLGRSPLSREGTSVKSSVQRAAKNGTTCTLPLVTAPGSDHLPSVTQYMRHNRLQIFTDKTGRSIVDVRRVLFAEQVSAGRQCSSTPHVRHGIPSSICSR
jgi:hypothetical protein